MNAKKPDFLLKNCIICAKFLAKFNDTIKNDFKAMNSLISKEKADLGIDNDIEDVSMNIRQLESKIDAPKLHSILDAPMPPQLNSISNKQSKNRITLNLTTFSPSRNSQAKRRNLTRMSSIKIDVKQDLSRSIDSEVLQSHNQSFKMNHDYPSISLNSPKFKYCKSPNLHRHPGPIHDKKIRNIIRKLSKKHRPVDL